MSNKQEIYNAYSSALFSLAKEENAVEKYSSCLHDISSLLKTNDDFYKAMNSFSLPYESKCLLLDKIIKNAPKSLLPFLKILARDHLYSKFDKIAREYYRLANEELGIKEGLAFSAFPLSEKEIKELEKTLEKKVGCKIYLDNKVEPSLIGGVKVAIDGKVYDGTIANKIETLRKTLLGGAK
ncbi:MAG: F0F1 ATP synthase subunit delta [Bacilli bacterium]|nr:F0F1 ATP synthase subunit delta [Bacilli bacterium]